MSVAAQPFKPVIGASDYHVDILISTGDQPFVPGQRIRPHYPPTIPETYLQSYALPRTSEFWKIEVITLHYIKDLEYLLTITTGALDIQGITEELTGDGIVGRVRP